MIIRGKARIFFVLKVANSTKIKKMFADKYLMHSNFSAWINENPDAYYGISIVIPCFRETEVLKTLNSIARCFTPKKGVEVIILINHPETAQEAVKGQNRLTKQEIDQWISKNPRQGIQFFAIGPVELKKKWAGVGLARKRGMDEAVRRFNLQNNPDGIVVSLDADTLVEENYLVEIERYFNQHPAHAGATISFGHQTAGLDARQLQGIKLYEKYMSYYKSALAYTGYPYPMFTVGSAFAVRAGAYVKRGGMNRRQAGEDFYFLQNLVQLGPVGEISETTVHPSARISDRVPFGTGPVLQKWMKGEEDLRRTYNFMSFTDLKIFFEKRDMLFRISFEDYKLLISDLPSSIRSFLNDSQFWIELEDLNRNCATLSTFRIRFYHKFNAFKILKYLNFSHSRFYEKADLEAQFSLLAHYSA
jgi:glycosyltransferase involved in cell wall biosynthesis